MRHFAPWTADSPDRDPLTYAIIGCAIDVHRTLGPGLRESAYEESLSYAFRKERLDFSRQIPLPACYEGIELGKAYRPDFILEREVVVEVKAVERLLPIHDAQLITYLRFSQMQRGLLLNFRARRMVTGIRRLVLTR